MCTPHATRHGRGQSATRAPSPGSWRAPAGARARLAPRAPLAVGESAPSAACAPRPAPRAPLHGGPSARGLRPFACVSPSPRPYLAHWHMGCEARIPRAAPESRCSPPVAIVSRPRSDPSSIGIWGGVLIGAAQPVPDDWHRWGGGREGCVLPREATSPCGHAHPPLPFSAGASSRRLHE